MDQLNLICKIGAYLPINELRDFLTVKKGIDSPLFWRLVIAVHLPGAIIKKNYKQYFGSYLILKNNIRGSEHIWLSFALETSKHWNEDFFKIIPHNIRYFCDIVSDFSYSLRLTFDLKEVRGISFPFLTTLILDGGSIKKIVGLNLPALINLNVKNNKLVEFSGNHLPRLKYLNLKQNFLRKIDLKPYTFLREVVLKCNYLCELNIAFNPYIYLVYAEYNQLKSIILNANPNLRVHCKGNPYL